MIGETYVLPDDLESQSFDESSPLAEAEYLAARYVDSRLSCWARLMVRIFMDVPPCLMN